MFRCACLSLATTMLMLALGITHAADQTAGGESWQVQTESRLKAIYDRRELTPRSFQVEWLSDSSGYTISETEPGTDKTVSVTYDVRTGERVTEEPEKKKASRKQHVSPDGSRVLEIHERAVVIREIASGKRVALTKPLRERDVWYENLAWSPDGRRVLLVEADRTDVRQRSVLDASDPSYPMVHKHRFARVGETIESLRVGVADADGKQLTWLPLVSPDEGFYLGRVEWAGNSDEVLIEQLSRFRDRREFFLAKTTGELKRIFHEESETWIDASQGKNLGLKWIRGGQAFVVISEMDGWRHAHLWSREGKPLAVLTPGKYDLIDRAVVDEEGGWYYFYASPDNATQKYLYRVPLDGSGTLERISPTNQPGTHQYEFSPDLKWAIHTYASFDSPPVVDLIELAGHRIVRVVEDNRAVRERLKNYQTHPTEFLQLKIAGDVSMDAWLLKPKNFDPAKKYPVFIYVYGEPHGQTVLDDWSSSHIQFHRVIADLGYIVVSIDNRGTPAPKGAAWRRSVFGSLGPLSTEEQEAGLKELGRVRPYVDLSRVGIWGWSGGGSNTLNAMFRKPDSYHVGIAVVPKPQPHLYNAWFQEIFMRTREVNPDGYHRAAALTYAEGLKGKLLIITGSGETNTHIQIIEGLVDRLIELGKPFDYMVYPYRDHGLREGKGTVVHVRMLIARYLMDNLPAGGR